LAAPPPTVVITGASAGVGRASALRFAREGARICAIARSQAGLDEVRRYNAMQRSSIACFADALTVSEIKRTFAYMFNGAVPPGGGLPEIELFTLAGDFCLGRTLVTPVPIFHGRRMIFGYRIGTFAYLTDCSRIPDGSWPLLDGVRTLVIGALRDRPHPTHFTVDQAVAAIQRIGPERAYLTHIAHDLPHAATCARLPAGVQLAYDGLTLQIPA